MKEIFKSTLAELRYIIKCYNHIASESKSLHLLRMFHFETYCPGTDTLESF